MALKYQYLVDNSNLEIECPRQKILLDQQKACRFIKMPIPEKYTGILTIRLPISRGLLAPIEHNTYFLPNIITTELNGKTIAVDKGKPHEECLKCAISLYDCVDNAKKAWNKMSLKIKQRWGFTHIAHGVLNSVDGCTNGIDEDTGHFAFYEEINTSISRKLSTIEPI